MKYLILLASVIFLAQSCSVAPSMRESARSYDWATYTNFSWQSKIDSAISSYPLLLYPSYEAKGSAGFTVPLFYHMDKKKRADIEVRIKYKTENCNDLYLKLSGISECREVTSVDTFRLSAANTWRVARRSVDIASPLLLGVALEAQGEKPRKKDFPVDPLGSADNSFKPGEYSKIWIDSLDILIDGKYAVEPPSLNNGATASVRELDVIPGNGDDLKSLSFSDKRILAIGESVHGTGTMNDMGVEIIKNRIEHGKCRLVLLEMPLTLSFHINRYLEGDERFKPDSIASSFDKVLFSSSSFVSLMRWIKEYNRHSEEKVSFFGIDRNIYRLQSSIDLFYFFYTLRRGKGDEGLKAICNSLLLSDEKFPFKGADSVLHANHGFKGILTRREAEIMSYCLNAEEEATVDELNRFRGRDSGMYENAKFLMKTMLKKDETTTVYCHLGHANYTSIAGWLGSDMRPFGEYMKGSYGDDYSAVGLLAGGGSYLTWVFPGKMGIRRLQSSSSAGLEYCIERSGISPCYLPMDKLSDADVLKMRYIGNTESKIGQFQWVFPKCMMDGVLFTKNASATNKREEFFKMNLDYHVQTLFALMYLYEKKRKWIP